MRFLLIFFLIPCRIFAQEYTISGYVFDSTTMEPLVGAHVVHTLSKSAITNNNGYYHLHLDKTPAEVTYSYVGTIIQKLRIVTSVDTVVNTFLRPKTLDMLTISGYQKPYQSVNRSGIPIEKIRTLPSLGGEVDVLKSLTLLPGISPTIEGSTGLSVRGGSPDQNLILLDEAPVYNVSHLFGFISVFNPYAIKNIEVMKGAFPARYGGRLSSVINIAMNEGNKKEFEGEVTLGLISSKLNMEIPIIKNKTSLAVSGRSAYLDLISLPQRIGFEKGTKRALVNYSLLDGNVKLHHLIDDKSSISLSHYSSRDNYSDLYRPTEDSKYTSTVGWSNMINSLRYNRIISERLMVEGVVYHSRYQYGRRTATEEFAEESESIVDFTSGSAIEDISGKLGLGFNLGPQHRLYAGGQYIHHRYTPSDNSYILISDGQTMEQDENLIQSTGIETAIFIEDEWSISSLMSANLGVRYSAFDDGVNSFSGLEPRAELRYRINSRYTLSVSHSHMRQYIHLLTSNTVGLPNDIWVPVTGLAPPEKSWISALGIEGQLNETYRATAEVFYREMNDLIDQGEGTNPSMVLDGSWDELIENQGQGQAYGFELYVEKQKGKLTGWLSYTLSWNYRQFQGINDGIRFPYRYDRRHQLSLVGEYQLSKKWAVMSNWIYMTGYAITLPVAQYFIRDPFEGLSSVLAYDERNNGRMPDYHRLDVSFARTKITRKGRRAVLNLGVYNLYMRRNPLYVSADYRTGHGPEAYNKWGLQLNGRAYFQFIPSISYTLHF